MTTRHQHDHSDDDAVDRWLEEQQGAMIDDLSTVMDVEASLREILIQSRHDDMVDDLDTVLDVEGCLAAILPATTAARPKDDLRLNAAELQLTPVEQFIRSVSPQDRLALRSHPRVVAAYRALSNTISRAGHLREASFRVGLVTGGVERSPIDLHSTLSHIRALAMVLGDLHGVGDLANARLFVSDLTRHLDHARAVVRDLGTDPDCAFEPIRTVALEGLRDLNRDLKRVRGQVGNLIEDRVHQTDAIIGEILGRDVPALDKELVRVFLDDFTTSDLRTVNLSGIDLVGVRWSQHGTLWPEDVDVDDLKTRSEETPPGSGIYVIRSDWTTVRDSTHLS